MVTRGSVVIEEKKQEVTTTQKMNAGNVGWTDIVTSHFYKNISYGFYLKSTSNPLIIIMKDYKLIYLQFNRMYRCCNNN